MKKLAFILALILCILPLASCGDPEARDILDADGNAIATGYYDGDDLVREEKVDSNGDLSKKTVYDSKGRVEKIENYTLKTLFSEVEYAYTDKDGEYTEKTTSYNNKGIVVSITETVYKDSHPVSQTITTPTNDENAAVSECTFTYNKDGSVLLTYKSLDKVIRETLEDGNDVMIYDHEFRNDGSSTKTFYDKGTVISKVETYNAKNELLVTVANTYNDDGKLVRTDSYGADGALRDYSEYVYDGNTLKGIHRFNADGTIKSTVVYDENGKATIHDGTYVGLN